MYIYNGKFFKDEPRLKNYDKQIKIDKENIMLSLLNKETLSKEILYTFSINYYNTPVEPDSYLFERLVDLKSLEKTILDNLKEEKFITIKNLKVREVVLSFNIEKWLAKAIKPLEISSKKGVGTYYIKPNINLPVTVHENIDAEDSFSICRALKSILGSSDFYIKRFRGSFPKDLIFQEHKTLNFIEINYNLYNNKFEISIRNDILQMLYFSNKWGK